MMEDQLIKDEEKIVWLDDIEQFDYVRESIVYSPTRVKKPYWPKEFTVVGYSVLNQDAERFDVLEGFQRRLYWLKDRDRQSGGGTYKTGCPCEAVDPRTVMSGIPGQMTQRARGESQ